MQTMKTTTISNVCKYLKNNFKFNEITKYKYAVLAVMSEHYKSEKIKLTNLEFKKINIIAERIFNGQKWIHYGHRHFVVINYKKTNMRLSPI